MMTGVHGLHVVAGMGVILWILIRAAQGRTSAEEATFAKKKEARDAKKTKKWLEEKRKRDALLKKKTPPPVKKPAPAAEVRR